MFKGYLKIAILNELQHGEKTGYDIIKSIQNRTKILKPSPGCVYPSLKELLEKGLIKISIKKSKKYYSLTPKGKIEIKELNKQKKRLFEIVMNKLKVAKISINSKDIDELEVSKENLKLIKPLLKDLIALKDNLIKYLSIEKRNNIKIKEIKRILSQANKEIVELINNVEKQK
ncbi:MAG: PadR family transcriptional regulator [Candidatus Woesearchaeota archaeon]